MTPTLAYWLVARMVLAATILALVFLAGGGVTYDSTPLSPTAGQPNPASFNPDGTYNLEVSYAH